MATQQWRHGWIPLTPAAVREKNHGKTPGPDSKVGKSAAARSKGTSQRMDAEIRRAARGGDRNVRPDRPSSSDDVSEATKAIRAGDHARAVNLLTRAMNNAKGAEKAAIKKQRDELARRLMRGR
ncbi:hypothetical protein [Nonomuraea sp. GTA35]|uniref:hypothetical protein n=1 Tax=Nonomuraea sp. GTA35 TaxID=1676746 RepID=UPI0035C0DA62